MLEIKVLGDLQVLRDGAAVALPPSRKTRALLAYLALTRCPHRRERLCEIFWDIPDDPRGSLRWSLSKIRPLVDDPSIPRLMADRQNVELRAGELDVDLLSVRRCMEATAVTTGDLARAASAFRGPLLADLDLPENGEFHTWLLGQREDARQLQAKKALRRLIERLGASPEEALRYARELVRVDPFDETAWAQLVATLASAGRTARSGSNTRPVCVPCATSAAGRGRCCGLGVRRRRQHRPAGGAAATTAGWLPARHRVPRSWCCPSPI